MKRMQQPRMVSKTTLVQVTACLPQHQQPRLYLVGQLVGMSDQELGLPGPAEKDAEGGLAPGPAHGAQMEGQLTHPGGLQHNTGCKS